MSSKSTNVSSSGANANYGYKEISKNGQQVLTATKPTIFVGMLRTQAEAEGSNVLALFDLYDIGHNDGKIDLQEYAKYQMDLIPEEQRMQDIQDFKNLPKEKRLVFATEKILSAVGMDVDCDKINGYLNSKDRVDLASYSKDELGIDLSQYKTKEEKQKAFNDTIAKKYAINLDDKDSLYAQIYERLKKGEYTDFEKNVLHLRGQLTDEQAAEYAKMVLMGQQIQELSKAFLSGDTDTQVMLINSMPTLSPEVATAFIGIASMAADKNTDIRETLCKLMNNKDVTVTDSMGRDILRNSMSILFSQFGMGDSRNIFASWGFMGDSQFEAFGALNEAERMKVTDGVITQEEYDYNYANIFADIASQMQEADKAYEYVIQNTNDNNRQATLNKLASNVHNIEDENKRNSALSSLRSSSGYNEEVELNIVNGFVNRALGNSAGSAQTVHLHNGSSFAEEYTNIVTPLIKSGNSEAVEALMVETFKALKDQGLSTKGKTIKETFIQQTSAAKILDILIKEDLLQGTQYEVIAIKHLSAMSNQTLVEIFKNVSQPTREFLYDKNHIIPLLSIVLYTTREEEKSYSTQLQEEMDEMRRNLNIA